MALVHNSTATRIVVLGTVVAVGATAVAGAHFAGFTSGGDDDYFCTLLQNQTCRYDGDTGGCFPVGCEVAGGVCHSSPAGSGCTPIQRIRDRGVDVGVQATLDLRKRAYVDVRVFGLARDGVDNVSLRLQNGDEVEAPVRDNTFLVIDLPDRPSAVSWNDAARSRSLTVPGPTAEALAVDIAGP